MSERGPMNAKEFEAKMLKAEKKAKTDPLNAHEYADRVMCRLLERWGYGDGVRAFERMEKWYS